MDHFVQLTFDPCTNITDGPREAQQVFSSIVTSRLCQYYQAELNAQEIRDLLSAHCLAQKSGNNPEINSSITGRRKISREEFCVL